VLVCIGSFLFTSVGLQFIDADATRIPAQIVSGMGFLGAGVILREGKNIRGLNTAATLWCNAALGVLCASGMLFEAVVGSLFILFSNIILRLLANKMVDKAETTKKFILTISCSPKKAIVIRTLLLQRLNSEKVMLDDIENISEGEKVTIVANIEIDSNSAFKIDKIMNRMSMEPDVYSVGWKKDKEQHRDPKDDDVE
jgi:putative Mg2+ transporter-C (MgtC) family protein